MPAPPSAPPRGGLRRRLFAWLMACSENDLHERLVAERKQALLGSLTGVVVEIGPGTGASLPYLRRDVRWIGLEPNPYMHPYLRKKAESLGIEVDLRHGSADRMDVEDGAADAVVSTLVLCSVADVAAVLREVLRVLKPGGRFVFLEHVAAPKGTWLRRGQRIVRPLWRWIGDGCTPDRETRASIEQAGFREVRCEGFRVPVPLVAPHIAGVATKP